MLYFHILNIFLFFVYTYGLGYGLTSFIKKNSFEVHILRIGVGLGALPLLGTILNLLHIPVDYRIILLLSLSLIIFNRKNIFLQEKSQKTASSFSKVFQFLAVGLFMFNLLIYVNGAFAYPWLEDDDSWSHAASTKYVALEKNLNPEEGTFQYLNPYPPGYDTVLGLMHQSHPSLYWVLKFFNALFVSLSFLFFFIFVKKISQGNEKLAFLSTFFLSCIPCYLSHFIWAHSLAMALFFPAFYCLIAAEKEKHFLLPASVLVAGILLTQPTESIKFLVMAIIVCLAWIIAKKSFPKKIILALMIGTLLSLLWWAPKIIHLQKNTLQIVTRSHHSLTVNSSQKTKSMGKNMFSPSYGTATRAYTPSDYFFPPRSNMINNPIGVGPMLSILSLLGILYAFLRLFSKEEKNKTYYLSLLGWTLFTFLGMNSMTFHLPIGLFAFRFWMLFAIPVCILSADILIHALDEKKGHINIIVLLVCVLSILTSAKFKLQINTSMWPYGVYWKSHDEMLSYVWMRKHLPPDTKIFTFTDNLFVIGHDMRSDYWREDYQKTFAHAIDLSEDELAQKLKNKNYQFLLIDQRTLKKYGEDLTHQKIQVLIKSPHYSQMITTQKGVLLFKIRS